MRLRDVPESEHDDALREAGRLLRAVASPTDEASPWLQHTVRAELSRRRRAVAVPRLAMALALLLIGAFASAAAWRVHVQRVRAKAEAPVAAQKRVHGKPAAPSIAAPSMPLVVAPVVAPVAAPIRDSAPIARRTHVEPKLPDVEVPRAPLSDALLLQRATRAWKHEHDATLAAQLADEQLHSFPDSDVREEAFALSMSAHEALGDDVARTSARRYLFQFPAGRFREQATRLLTP